MASRVEMIPKKAMVSRCWKNWGFLIVYPTEKTIGGRINEKKKSLEKLISFCRTYIAKPILI